MRLIELWKERKSARIVLYWAMAIVTLYALVNLFGPDRVWSLIEWAFGAVFPGADT